jgi:ankyrin repeat protein
VTELADPLAAFVVAACAPLDSGHSSGTLERAQAILVEHPGFATASVYTAAILGDDDTVRRFLDLDPANATAKGGPHHWDALTHLCFSRFLRLDRDRTPGFVRAATALLDAGASANSGWFEPNHQPEPEWEPVLYGAAGVAHHPELTRLLLERGANPNDGEVVYHTPESYDNAALEILVKTGKLTAQSLALMLIRKHDWHDYKGAKFLLEHGADPNGPTGRGWHAMHHALARDNALRMFELLLDHGADPTVEDDGLSAIALAAREGRSDVLDLFRRRNIPVELHGVDRLIGACACNDTAAVHAIAQREPQTVRDLLAMGGTLLAKFAGTGNPDGVRQLLDLGVDVRAPFTTGDGYWGLPKNCLALHVAAWRLQHAVVKLLIERGSPVDVPNAHGHTPLFLCVRASVDSYWTEMRSPDSVRALLGAGASVSGIPFPSGYTEADDLLRAHREHA